MWRPILGFVIVVIVGSTILSTYVIDEQVPVTKYKPVPYSYQPPSFIRAYQPDSFLWLPDKTEVQYSVMNTDDQKGTFVLNYKFDNGAKTETKTDNVELLPGVEKVVTMKSSLDGESKVGLEVIPPQKQIAYQDIVIEKHNGWYYLPRWLGFVK